MKVRKLSPEEFFQTVSLEPCKRCGKAPRGIGETDPELCYDCSDDLKMEKMDKEAS